MQNPQTNYELYKEWRKRYPVDILFSIVEPSGYGIECFYDDASIVHGVCDVYWRQDDINGGVVFKCCTVPSILKTHIIPVLIKAGYSIGLLNKNKVLHDAEIYNYV
jgi:DNA mismatch repair ATPase MutS